MPEISDSQSLIQILRHGDFLRHSKQDIVSFLTSDRSEAEKAEYIKGSYPTLLFAEFYKEGTEEHLGYRAAEDGLLLYEGNFMTRKAETLMDWPFVTELIGALIKDGNYLDEPQADKQMTLFDAEQGRASPCMEVSSTVKTVCCSNGHRWPSVLMNSSSRASI